MTPASTFDNVKGSFPIGFFIYDTSKNEKFDEIIADVYNSSGEFITTKGIYSFDSYNGKINNWIKNSHE